ncbi:hypothetical protein RCL1_009067 [Eukaryota sp. TZLM3-RCL]
MNYVTLAEIVVAEEGSILDLIGVLVKKFPPSTVFSQKFDKLLEKMDIIAGDDSLINLTVFGRLAPVVNTIPLNSVLHLTSVKAASFAGNLNLSTIGKSRVILGTMTPRHRELADYIKFGGKFATNLSQATGDGINKFFFLRTAAYRQRSW